jgi:BlaI family transcriptional regulator, penicillinase repressor
VGGRSREPASIGFVDSPRRSTTFVDDLQKGRSNPEAAMPDPAPDALSRAEWKVMKIVWRRGRVAARDVVAEAASAHDWRPSTVKTLLKRLVDKGHLKATRVGNSFLYEPIEEPLPALQRAGDTLLDHAVEGLAGPLLVHLVKKSRLSAEELAELRALLDAKKGRGR